jgi:hypothetical protein
VLQSLSALHDVWHEDPQMLAPASPPFAPPVLEQPSNHPRIVIPASAQAASLPIFMRGFPL